MKNIFVSIIFLTSLYSCQDTSVLEVGREEQSASELALDQTKLTSYEGNDEYVNSDMTIVEAIASIARNTSLMELNGGFTTGCITWGDSAQNALWKLQRQVNASCIDAALGSSGAKGLNSISFNPSNSFIYNSYGIFSDENTHQNGVKFEEDNGISIYANESLSVSLNPDQVEIHSDLYVDGQVYSLSDKRAKSNIQKVKSPEAILRIEGKTFNWKKNNKKDIGFIAQDVENHFPEAVKVGKDGLKRIDYSKLIVPLLELVKHQQKEIEVLKNIITK